MATIYLLFGLGRPSGEYSNIKQDVMTAFERLDKENVFNDFCLKPVYLVDKKKSREKPENDEAIYAIYLTRVSKNHEYAQKIADAICAAVTFCGRATYFHEGLIAYPISERLIKNDIMTKNIILNFDRRRKDNEHIGEPRLWHLMSEVCMIPKHIMFYAMKILPTILQSDDIFEAVQYYQDSLFSVEFDECNVLRNPDGKPRSSVQKKKYENAAHNAFKAIESILGEPPRRNPKGDKKLRDKLNSLRINPDEKIGYADKESIFDKLRKFHFVRDKKSAHAKTGHSKTITDYELMDFQRFTQYFIDLVIDEKLKQNPNG